MGQIEQIKQLLRGCSPEERRQVLRHLRQEFPIHPLEAKLNAPAEMILEAIDRAGDLTLRGVRGVIAEAAFVTYILPKLKGWTSLEIEGDQSFDFLLADGQAEPVRVQVKLQRQQRQRPMKSEEAPRHLGYPPGLFIVETQRTRTGKGRQGENTRPYRFGEFDILAVSLHPSYKRKLWIGRLRG
ncbi:MAG TPA: hypothetical protein VIL13_08565 [Longimicrobiales bacterium]